MWRVKPRRAIYAKGGREGGVIYYDKGDQEALLFCPLCDHLARIKVVPPEPYHKLRVFGEWAYIHGSLLFDKQPCKLHFRILPRRTKLLDKPIPPPPCFIQKPR